MSELTVSQDGLTYPVRYVEGGKLFDSVVEPPFDDHYFKVVVCCCGFYGPLYGSYYNFRRWILPGFYFKDKNYVFDPDKKILIYGPIPEVESYDYTLTLSRPGYKDVNIRAVFNIPENTERRPYKGHYNNKDIYQRSAAKGSGTHSNIRKSGISTESEGLYRIFKKSVAASKSRVDAATCL